MIIKLIDKYKDNIMEYTLGSKKDESFKLYSDIYKYEWSEFKNRLKGDIGYLEVSQLNLTSEILTYLIINQWSGVWYDKGDLNISELKKLSSRIINEAFSYKCFNLNRTKNN